MNANLGEVVGGAGPWEAGGPHGPRHRQRVGSQGGMPTRSPPEAGLAGSESHKCPSGAILFYPEAPCQWGSERNFGLAEVPQNPVENPAVAVVADLVGSVETNGRLEHNRVAVIAVGGHLD